MVLLLALASFISVVTLGWYTQRHRQSLSQEKFSADLVFLLFILPFFWYGIGLILPINLAWGESSLFNVWFFPVVLSILPNPIVSMGDSFFLQLAGIPLSPVGMVWDVVWAYLLPWLIGISSVCGVSARAYCLHHWNFQ